jgi:hypothetical protein
LNLARKEHDRAEEHCAKRAALSHAVSNAVFGMARMESISSMPRSTTRRKTSWRELLTPLHRFGVVAGDPNIPLRKVFIRRAHSSIAGIVGPQAPVRAV